MKKNNHGMIPIVVALLFLWGCTTTRPEQETGAKPNEPVYASPILVHVNPANRFGIAESVRPLTVGSRFVIMRNGKVKGEVQVTPEGDPPLYVVDWLSGSMDEGDVLFQPDSF